ncbi:MAG: single-stranded DNA-binding protein [Vallitaleaceae bacterium]|jgi:single-strand DNA-binding protein|nr:single-stranded DNA-binding protein [Vallitaleaceae bacterium]
MNKVILMGRLTRDPEVRYSQASEPLAIANYSLAVNRRFARDGQQSADFINMVAFGRDGEFAGKYFKKGQLVAVVGRIQTGSYDDKDGNKRYTTEVVVEEQHFAESKRSFEERDSSDVNSFEKTASKAPAQSAPKSGSADGFVPMSTDFDDDDDLPF